MRERIGILLALLSYTAPAPFVAGCGGSGGGDSGSGDSGGSVSGGSVSGNSISGRSDSDPLDGTSPPSIVVMIADDMGWGDIGFHGSDIRTPRLDALASEGAKLEHFYAQPNCTPTRAAFFTGRYPFRYGLQRTLIRPWAIAGLASAERTLPELLREAGYATHLVGKWHLGHAKRSQIPTERGFDHHYGCYSGAVDHYTHRRAGALDWHRDGKPDDKQGYSTDLIADEAVRILSEHDFEQPLFLVVAFIAPHLPLQVPQEFIEPYADLTDARRMNFSGMVSCLDRAAGRIADEIDARDNRNNTLLLFFSDNGGSRHDGGNNGFLIGRKGQSYEGALRVPAFVRWPERIPRESTVNAKLHVVDLYPTLGRIAGANLKQPRPIDGLDISTTLLGGADPVRNELPLRITGYDAALISGNWKLIRQRFKSKPQETKLFDLSQSPTEKNNVAAEYPKLVNQLLARIDVWEKAAVRRITVPETKPDSLITPAFWGPPQIPQKKRTRK